MGVRETVGDDPWEEIDTPDDLERARDRFSPLQT